MHRNQDIIRQFNRISYRLKSILSTRNSYFFFLILYKMKKAYVCPKTRPLTIGLNSFVMGSQDAGEGVPVMGSDVKGTAASGRLW